MEQKKLIDNSGQQMIEAVKIDSYLQIFIYYIQDFLNWWYVKMPIWHLRTLGRISVVVDDNLSISLLFKNFFVPWRRDNSLMGYAFGFIIKSLYLPIAIVIYLSITTIYLFLIIIWVLLPVAIIVFIITSIFK